jgi:outer membrane lipoprotein-sorting protein
MNQSELDEAIAQLQRASIPAGPGPTLISSTIAAMSRQTNRPPLLRRQRRYAAIAAAIIIALGVGLLLMSRDSSTTFAQVVQEVEKTHTLQGKADEPGFFKGKPFYIKGKLERYEMDNPIGGIGPYTAIVDRASNETFVIFTDAKRAVRENGTQLSRGDLVSMIRDVAEHPVQSIGEKAFDGRTLIGFAGSMKEPGPDGKPRLTPVRVWVDPKTKLPARLEYFDSILNQVTGVLTDLQWDVPLDDALFAMKAPDGYKVQDQRSNVVLKLRPPATTQQAARLVIHPGVGIGEVKLGDSMEKLVAFLGEPEVKGNYGLDGKEINANYPSLGLRFDVGWDWASVPDDSQDWKKLRPQDMKVKKFFADSGGIPSPTNDFPGATDRGIRVGSTRKEVEAVYGKPAWQNQQNADYRELGMAVTYSSDGTTVSGFVILKPSKEPIFGPIEDLQKDPATRPAPATTQKGLK